MPDLKTLKTQFLEYLEVERGRSVKTTRNYDHYLSRFLALTKATAPAGITEELVRQFRLRLNRLTDEKGQPLKKVTQNYHVIALRAFLKYLAKRDIPSIAAEKIELGKPEQRQISIISGEELERLLEAPDQKTLTGLRDKAILEVLFSTGLRVSELCFLDRDKINIKGGEFSVKGKGSKIRLVFLSERAKQFLTKYLEARVDADPALFIRIPKNHKFQNYEDLRLTPRSIQRIIQNYKVKAGIVENITPHGLRHLFATDLLRNGADIRSVQALLGHASVTTTQIYTHVTDKQLRETHQKYHSKQKGAS